MNSFFSLVSEFPPLLTTSREKDLLYSCHLYRAAPSTAGPYGESYIQTESYIQSYIQYI